MKCQFCGANFDDIEELCPECGKYINEETEELPIEKTEKDKSRGQSIEIFEFKDGQNVRTACNVFIGIFLIGSSIKFFLEFSDFWALHYFSLIDILLFIMPVFGVLFIVKGIAEKIISQKCFVSVRGCAIYGIIPKFPFRTEPFEIRYDEIIKIDRKGFSGIRGAVPRIIITTANGKTVIRSLNSAQTKDISDHLYKLMDP